MSDSINQKSIGKTGEQTIPTPNSLLPLRSDEVIFHLSCGVARIDGIEVKSTNFECPSLPIDQEYLIFFANGDKGHLLPLLEAYGVFIDSGAHLLPAVRNDNAIADRLEKDFRSSLLSFKLGVETAPPTATQSR